MPRRGDPVACLALALALAHAPGCSRRPEVREVEVGRHRVRFVLPEGWEHLDHGRQQLFRQRESQLSLVDLGPATREAIAREIASAESLWLAGRRRDAFQQIREIRAPSLKYASWRARADFWSPWTNATYVPEAADSARIGAAFAGLAAGVEQLPEVTPELLLGYVWELGENRRGREIGARHVREIHGSEWTDIESWNRVSHLDRSRTAFLEHDGNLLVLAIDRGPFELTGPGFEDLLYSLEVTTARPAVR